MNIDATKYVKNSNGQILYDGIKLELFVPEEYFKTGLAEEVGQSFNVFGNIRAYHYLNKNDDRNKAIKSTLTYPSKFYTTPDEVTIDKIDIGYGEEKYRILTYYKNAILFNNNKIIKSIDNLSAFFTMLTAGRLDMVEYCKLARMMQLSKYYNGVSFGTPAMYEEVIISDYYRDPTDPKRAARFYANETNDPHFHARGITQREKVAFTSTFSSITFEDVTSMVTMADNAARSGKKELVSEVEKVSLGEI